MSEHIEFNYAGTNSGGTGFTTTPELIASVEAHLARWQVANSQPRVYFEMTNERLYHVVYETDAFFSSFPSLPCWTGDDIEYKVKQA